MTRERFLTPADVAGMMFSSGTGRGPGERLSGVDMSSRRPLAAWIEAQA